MDAILIGIIFLLVFSIITAIIEYWYLLVLFAVIIVIGVVFLFRAHAKHIEKVVRAEIVNTSPIIKKVREKVGDTVSFGGPHLWFHNHYEYKDVITGYNVSFSVTFENGTTGTVTCKEGTYTYYKLLEKTR